MRQQATSKTNKEVWNGVKIKAELNNLRISPRKVRLVIDAIKGKSVPEAERILKFIGRRAAGPIAKALASAVANARQNFQISSDILIIAKADVNGGSTLKRSRPRAMGRSFPIRKRTSHIKLILESRGALPKLRRIKKSEIALIESDDGRAEPGGENYSRERERSADKPKVATKTTDFVRRMFRRKAI